MTDMHNINCVHQQGFHFGDCVTLRLVHSQTERPIVCQFNSQKSILKYSFLVRRTGPVNFQVKTDDVAFNTTDLVDNRLGGIVLSK